jgi:hypothetical protein
MGSGLPIAGRKSQKEDRAAVLQAKLGKQAVKGKKRARDGADSRPAAPKKSDLRSSTAFFGRMQDNAVARAKGLESGPKKATPQNPGVVSAAGLKL